MSFTKKQYTAGVTPITADNLNEIQDELLRLDNKITYAGANTLVALSTYLNAPQFQLLGGVLSNFRQYCLE